MVKMVRLVDCGESSSKQGEPKSTVTWLRGPSKHFASAQSAPQSPPFVQLSQETVQRSVLADAVGNMQVTNAVPTVRHSRTP
jgi:hypothetical protein